MSAPAREFRVSAEDAGARLDAFVGGRAGVSRAVAAKLIAAGDVTVAGRPATKSQRVEEGMRVSISLPDAASTTLEPEDIPVQVVYEDQQLLVVSKPAGLVVHPAPGHPSGTLVNALLARWRSFKGLKGDLRPGIVHRLDKDTSGLLIVARNDAAMLKLAAQIKNRRIKKEYM